MPLEFRPKLDKIVELLLYLATARPNADKYQAVKFFYLADKEHLSRFGRPITFEQYFALSYGPVASKAMDLLNGDQRTYREANIEALPFVTENVPRHDKHGVIKSLLYIREPLRKFNSDLFSKSDLRIFDEIIAKYGDKSFGELFKITHSHYAYQRAWRSRGDAKHARMRYDEMIEDKELRALILEDIGPVSAHMG